MAEPNAKPWTARPAEPYQPGNQVGVRHGAYAELALAPRARELADDLREIVPGFSVADEPIVQILALVLARIEAASRALQQVDELLDEKGYLAAYSDKATMFQRLREDTRGWVNTARRLCADLGLNPTSRAKLGRDVVQLQGEALTLQQLVALAEKEKS